MVPSGPNSTGAPDRAPRQPLRAAPAWPPAYQWVRVQGVDVRVAAVGSGPVLLLLNGIGANIEMWQPLVQELSGRCVVMFDVPGTGETACLPGLPRFPDLADLVVELLDELGLSTVDVLGYSWGGVLAQELARSHPERLRRVVLAATVPGLGGRPPAPWVLGAMLTPLRYYSPTYLRLVSPLIYGAAVARDETHSRARQHRPPSLRGYLQQVYAVTGWSSRRWLKHLRVPVLVMAGRGDALAPLHNARILARDIPGARLEVLAGGHLFLLQQPAPAARVLAGFLD